MSSQYGSRNCVSHDDHFVGCDVDAMKHTFFQHPDKVSFYNSLPFISGHFGFNFCERFMRGRYSFTFLRNPASRIISFYYFCKNWNYVKRDFERKLKSYSFDDLLDECFNDHRIRHILWNNQAWSLAYGDFAVKPKLLSDFSENELFCMAKNNAERFSYIGFVETFQQDKNNIMHDIGATKIYVHTVRNSTHKRPQIEDIPKHTQRRIAKLTELDDELYKELFARHQSKFKKIYPKHICRYVSKEYNMKLSKLKETLPRYSQKYMDGLIDVLQQSRKDYLNLMERILCGLIYKDGGLNMDGATAFNHEIREYGWDWPQNAHTMIGLKRLQNVRELMGGIIGNNIPGDFIETGVWRGGASIMMRAILHTYGIEDRRVFVADSFEGLPPPNAEKYPADAGSNFHTYPQLAISLEDVQQNFSTYGLLDAQTVFIKGWFKDTLPALPTNSLALMRLDGDMYESTMDALVHLYDKLSVGGYVIIDDYHVVAPCKQAVEDFCIAKNITPTIQEIDGVGVYWKKQ